MPPAFAFKQSSAFAARILSDARSTASAMARRAAAFFDPSDARVRDAAFARFPISSSAVIESSVPRPAAGGFCFSLIYS